MYVYIGLVCVKKYGSITVFKTHVYTYGTRVCTHAYV